VKISHGVKPIHICTIANDLTQYAAMRAASFADAGFTEEVSSFTLFDNSNSNAYEPYSAYNQTKDSRPEPILIFCHQDVRTSMGDGYQKLLQVISEISEIDPMWGVLGNAGIDASYQTVARISDYPPTRTKGGKLPQLVNVLDENFLIVNNRHRDLRWSTTITGFHFYGPDICLNAAQQNLGSYVVDFHLEHLGKGEITPSYWKCGEQFEKRWRDYFHFKLVLTLSCVPVLLSKHVLLRRIFRVPWIKRRFNRPRWLKLALRLGVI
jgi:hypothetical protein